MKLNADILFSELKNRYNVEMSGPKSEELRLGRPEFYREEESDFLSDHLYLATVEHLPQRPRIRENAVLVVIGDGFVLNHYRDRMTVLLIRNRADFFGVFHAIQDIFSRYDAWEESLYEELLRECDLKKMADLTEPLFEKPLYIMDRSFRFLASSGTKRDSDWMEANSRNLSSVSLSTFLSESDLLTEKKNAMVLDLHDKPVLCVNLFDRQDRYEGCLCVDLTGEKLKGGETKLAEKFASFVSKAMERNPAVRNDGRTTIKQVMRALVNEEPLSRAQRVLLRSSDNAAAYVCLYMRTKEKHRTIPATYICDIFEEQIPGSNAFAKEDAIVAFVNVTEKEKDHRLRFSRAVRSFCTQMRLSAGVSNEFSELFDVRIHYLQAQSALEDGLLLAPDDVLFFFSSYALTEMVINSLGGLPVEAYYPEGLKAVIEHDKNAPVSYLETLRVLLEENLSYTAAAQRLFIHRSTLLDRIDRIEKEMAIDLKNSEQRLQLEILLRAMDLEAIMRRQ